MKFLKIKNEFSDSHETMLLILEKFYPVDNCGTIASQLFNTIYKKGQDPNISRHNWSSISELKEIVDNPSVSIIQYPKMLIINTFNDTVIYNSINVNGKRYAIRGIVLFSGLEHRGHYCTIIKSGNKDVFYILDDIKMGIINKSQVTSFMKMYKCTIKLYELS
jgi:ubiquitin C-terminal hydrolase